jgi:mRNA interferase RelE/StbE
MPTYDVEFRPDAARAFRKLGTSDQRQIMRKLAERRSHPRVPGDAVRNIPDGYRLKLRSSGIRVVYQVRDTTLVILILSIGGREREEAYKNAEREFRKLDD